jgi:hypothetical protein
MLLKMAIERVDFPIYPLKMGGFSIAMLVYQRVTLSELVDINGLNLILDLMDLWILMD